MEDSRSRPLSNNRQPQRRHPGVSLSFFREGLIPPQLSRAPSSETTLLANALVGKLEASDDLRYHLCWTYGDFLDDIPRRIGTNEALDAAVAALVSAHSSLGSHRGTGSFVPVEGLVAYSRAIRTLRIYLDDSARARTAETLCAVMLLLICQGFLGTCGGRGSTHGEGAAQILKARAYFDTRDDFECKLLLTLRGPVLFEALVNTRISFTPEEWGRLVENELDDATPEGLMIRCLARAPNLMQRGRTALREQAGLQMLISETRHQYQILTAILSGLRDRLDALPELSSGDSSQFVTGRTRAHAHYQRTYGLGLAMCIIFNCVLTALGADDAGLDTESTRFCEDVLELADKAAVYRPLGASYITLCLMAAWCGSKDEATKAAVESALLDYQTDLPGNLEETLMAHLERIYQRLSLLEPEFSRKQLGAEEHNFT